MSHSRGEKKCPNCGRVITEHEAACWHCEHDLDKTQNEAQKPHCFIASAVYGEDAWETNLLRNFRNNRLQPYLLGRVFIDLYYTISPVIARVIGKNNVLRRATKLFLDYVVFVVNGKRK